VGVSSILQIMQHWLNRCSLTLPHTPNGVPGDPATPCLHTKLSIRALHVDCGDQVRPQLSSWQQCCARMMAGLCSKSGRAGWLPSAKQ
jgi:hypothetical protein